MSAKRKRDLFDFDPNQSDPDDDNFDPTEARARPMKRASRAPRSNKSARSRPRSKGYDGSDIVDDEDERSDSDGVESYNDDEEEADDAPLNASGRTARRAATKVVKYAEPSDDDDEIIGATDEELPQPPAKKKKIVVLKTFSARSRASKEPTVLSSGTRRTRQKTEDADEEEFLELSNSGRHPRAVSSSRSPEPLSRNTRNSRATKPLVAEPIAEAEHESSFQPDENQSQADARPQGQGDQDVVADSDPEAAAAQDDTDEVALVQGDIDTGMVDVDADELATDEPAAPQDPEQDDSDDIPVLSRRNTRSLRHNASAAAPQEANNGETEVDAPLRTTRRTLRSRASRQKGDDVSDFEPNESGDGDGEGSEADVAAGGDHDEDDSSEPAARGRRTAARATRRTRTAESGDDEDELDHNEIAEEAEELRRSSRSRSKRRRRQPSPPAAIAYEERARRRTAKVDYTIKMPQEPVEQEDDDDAGPPASQRRRNNGGGNVPWVRTMNSTFGPFGGAHGTDSLLGGAWGTVEDAFAVFAGGADSDNSDDEREAGSGFVGGGAGQEPSDMVSGGGEMEKLGVGASPNVGRIKNRKALADADPLGVDMQVDFSKVGGLANHINQLKEMVMLPLLYPEVYMRFKMTPPRGVLFHGPPGTGKTLLARALANSIGSGGQKIAFYMRKGADALSKWVGEAEKQLRLLFEEARKTQPSIIFFDEIDGLAPVRSSKQEQIHASIVSTLLALMDGMDGRGQVIVIGATNRPDNIDPALRRPGRFDREFRFDLPDSKARKDILDIHTKDWGMSDEFKLSLAENTKGYGGADLRALCTEAALNAIQRTYPQIYSSDVKLVVDPSKINIAAVDFTISIKNMIPSSERSATSGAAPLPKNIKPLLEEQLYHMVGYLKNVLPNKEKTTALEEAMLEPWKDEDHGFGRENILQDFDTSRVFRPRLLITGVPGMGQNYLASAILHQFERVHVQKLDLASLLGDGRPVEQVIIGMFTEVRRHKPSVVFIPQIESWYASLGDSALTALTTMLQSLPPTDPILLLATSNQEVNALAQPLVHGLFSYSSKNRVDVARPTKEKRFEYFCNVMSYLKKSPPDFPDSSTRKKRILEVLPIAPPPPQRLKTKAEKRQENRDDRIALNHLKLRLQPIMDQLKKKYRSFYQPAIPYNAIKYLFEDADPNYVSADIAVGRHYIVGQDEAGKKVITEVATGKYYYNLDIGVIEERISNGFYARPCDFYEDIKTIVHDAQNMGDRKMVIKANEMLSNVDVDVAEIENKEGRVKYERLWSRQIERVRQAEEKAKKKVVLQAATSMVENGMNGQVVSDLNGQEHAAAEDQGPIRNGAPVPPEARTTASHFIVDPLPDELQQAEPVVPNDNAIGPRPIQSGTDDIQPTPFQMGPPQVPRASISTNSQLQDSSSGDRSTNWSTQATNGTNGFHNEAEMDCDGPQPPGTHPTGQSQETGSSNSPWYHSQADGMAHGRLNSLGHGGLGHGGLGHGGVDGATSPRSSQAPKDQQKAPVASRMGIGKVLNDPVSDDTSSYPNSGATATTGFSQVHIFHPEEADAFHREISERTSGCTIEQLEQVNRELMDQIWSSRNESNRMTVLRDLHMIFNTTIEDIENEQGLGKSSQPLPDVQRFYGSQ